jgi:hypothetical protein
MWIPVQASPCVSRSIAERGIRVLVQEVPQRRDKPLSMRNIVPPNGRANLIHQDVPDFFAPALALEQIIAKHSSRGLGDMLVRGHNLDFVGREIAEADQVFKRDHRHLLRRQRRATQLYLITCGLQSQACGIAAYFVALLLVPQAPARRPVSAQGRKPTLRL